MAEPLPPFSGPQLESICRIIADTYSGLTGSEIGHYLNQVGLQDINPELTKWRRLYNAFALYQSKHKRSNQVLNFISTSLMPVRFVGREDEFEQMRSELNKSLSFIGLEYRSTGKWAKVVATKTITEAEERSNRLISKLKYRNAHVEIFNYCNKELLVNNYFHSVFEAGKSVADRIRYKTGFHEDGAKLVDKAFGGDNPRLVINDFLTESDRSEQRGFVNLLKGMFGMFRNTTAHNPKITWNFTEEEALDIMSLISLIHKRLDKA